MIYFFENYDGFSCEKYLAYLPAERREKYERLKLRRDKENCVIAYILLRKALSDYGIYEPEFTMNENGKPFLKNSNIHFSISHTNSGVVVLAFPGPVGIDIQDIQPVRDGVMKRCFSDEEKEWVIGQRSPQRAFTRLWTLKESIVKCNGETVASLGNYCFEKPRKAMKKYDKIFTTHERKNLFISVCGDKIFSEIKEIENLEEIL